MSSNLAKNIPNNFVKKIFQLEPGLYEARHVLGDVIAQHLAPLPDGLLEVRHWLPSVADLQLVVAVLDTGQVTHYLIIKKNIEKIL